MDAFARFAQPWLDRAARIGADPRDADELRLRKALLVLVCVLILPISLAWGAIYLALGATAGLIAWLYLLISVAAIAIFSRTRDTEWFLRVELLDILLAPTISMAFVGGFVASGAVGLWGILAPLGALVFDGRARRRALVRRLRRGVPRLRDRRRAGGGAVAASALVRAAR